MIRTASPLTTALLTIAFVAAPALIALTIFQIKGDPRLRPFGLTESRMTNAAPPVAPGLVHVELHLTSIVQDPEPALALARRIKAAFTTKGQDAWVLVVRDPTATESFVNFRVGVNTFGPFSLDNAAAGVAPALKAVRDES